MDCGGLGKFSECVQHEPLRLRAAEMDFFKSRATVKCSITDSLYISRNNHGQSTLIKHSFDLLLFINLQAVFWNRNAFLYPTVCLLVGCFAPDVAGLLNFSVLVDGSDGADVVHVRLLKVLRL